MKDRRRANEGCSVVVAWLDYNMRYTSSDDTLVQVTCDLISVDNNIYTRTIWSREHCSYPAVSGTVPCCCDRWTRNECCARAMISVTAINRPKLERYRFVRTSGVRINIRTDQNCQRVEGEKNNNNAVRTVRTPRVYATRSSYFCGHRSDVFLFSNTRSLDTLNDMDSRLQKYFDESLYRVLRSRAFINLYLLCINTKHNADLTTSAFRLVRTMICSTCYMRVNVKILR